MTDLDEGERARLAALKERFGSAQLDPRPSITGEFGPIDPMLAGTLNGPLESVDNGNWVAEPKYDGTRLIVQHFDGEIRAYTRRHVERYDDIPAVHDDLAKLPEGLILDGELTFLTPAGTSQFRPIHTAREKLDAADLEMVYFVFDLLYAGADWTDRPLHDRRDRLESILPTGARVQLAPQRDSGFRAYFQTLIGAGEEGIMLKRRDSRYTIDYRSDQWLKVKRFEERDALAVGFTDGDGTRSKTFGALVLTDGTRCIGKVGSGFSTEELEALAEQFVETDEWRVSIDAVGEAYTPVEPFVVSVKYMEIGRSGKLRAPVFLRTNPEKPLDDVVPVELTGGA